MRATCTAALAVFSSLFLGCLGEPPIEERWTVLEIVEASPGPGETISPGETIPVSLRGRITFREILTGALVAEVRYSDQLTNEDVHIETEKPSLAAARDVDLILQNSVSGGMGFLPVTGFDHLVQEFDLGFEAELPAAGDSSGSGGAVFLLLYMAEEIDEVQLPSGEDSVVVNPLLSTEEDILSAGLQWSVD